MTKAILLDTNAVIWLLDRPAKFGTTSYSTLEEGTQVLMVSFFSLQEMTMKAANGKLEFRDSIYDDLTDRGVELSMPNRAALTSYKIFNPDNRDPFDNILLAVALSEGYDFMTSDQKILDTVLPGVRMIDSRC